MVTLLLSVDLEEWERNQESGLRQMLLKDLRGEVEESGLHQGPEFRRSKGNHRKMLSGSPTPGQLQGWSFCSRWLWQRVSMAVKASFEKEEV